MEGKLFISQLKEGMAIDSYFAIAEKELLEFKSKPGRYLQVKFKDKTGELWGKCWEEAEIVSDIFDVGDVVHIRGNVTIYNGHLQIQFDLRGVEKVDDYDIGHFIDSTDKDTDDLYAQIKGLIKSFSNAHLRNLLLSFFNDPEFESKFKISPCAKSHHHNYIGGLIEHTYSVLVICRTISRLYPSLDKELLLCGALLHDIGKMECYSVDVLIDVTPEGGLIDHVVLSFYKVKERISRMKDFPIELERKLLHMLLSHHGKREWGSPVLPMIEEASVLYHADLLDSQTSEFIKLKNQMDIDRKGIWSGYSRKLERFFYLGEESEI